MGKILIEGMEFYAFHGHFDEEKIVGNEFVVDIEITTNLKPAGKSDCLDDALNYADIYTIIQDEMKIKSSLLEHLANRIIDAIYIEYADQIELIQLKVSKLNPPLQGKIRCVSVEMSK